MIIIWENPPVGCSHDEAVLEFGNVVSIRTTVWSWNVTVMSNVKTFPPAAMFIIKHLIATHSLSHTHTQASSSYYSMCLDIQCSQEIYSLLLLAFYIKIIEYYTPVLGVWEKSRSDTESAGILPTRREVDRRSVCTFSLQFERFGNLTVKISHRLYV